MPLDNQAKSSKTFLQKETIFFAGFFQKTSYLNPDLGILSFCKIKLENNFGSVLMGRCSLKIVLTGSHWNGKSLFSRKIQCDSFYYGHGCKWMMTASAVFNLWCNLAAIKFCLMSWSNENKKTIGSCRYGYRNCKKILFTSRTFRAEKMYLFLFFACTMQKVRSLKCCNFDVRRKRQSRVWEK